jgi:tripartite-type tricarboxylate transporter receptor subunit TctC
VREALAKLGLEPGGNSPQEYAAMIADELGKWRRAVKTTGIKLD